MESGDFKLGCLTDLDNECVERKGVRVQNDPPNLPNDLVQTAGNHADRKSPRPPLDPLSQVDEHQKREDSDDGAIPRSRGLVFEDTGLQGGGGGEQGCSWRSCRGGLGRLVARP